MNCQNLKSIQFGKYSFAYYAGEFELKNLPKLESITIGQIGKTSCNFFHSLFVIRGIFILILHNNL